MVEIFQSVQIQYRIVAKYKTVGDTFEMKHTIIITFMLVGFLSHPSIGLDQPKHSKALECAALYYVGIGSFNALGEKYPEIGDNTYMFMQIFFELIHATHIEKRHLTNGEMSELKSNAADGLGEIFLKDPSKLTPLFLKCDRWYRKNLKTYNEARNTSKTYKEFSEKVRKNVSWIPEQISPTRQDIQKANSIISVSFQNWIKMGRLTPYKFQKELEKSINGE